MDPPPATRIARSRLRRLLAAARRPPYGPALVVSLLSVAFGALFVFSYTVALARPEPHAIPTAVVGSVAAERPLVGALQQATGSVFEPRPVPTEAAAVHAIEQQRVYAALALPTGERPRLLVASAAGASVARVLEQAAQRVQETSGRTLLVRDVAPLPSRDPNGLVIFYAALGATILGFISTFQLRANAAALSLRAWFAFKLAIAVGAGVLLALATGPLLGALGGSFPQKAALLGLEVTIASLFSAAMVVLAPRWALVPTWLLFVVIGNTSSGGAVAPPLLPPVLAFIGRWLPPGATVDALRTTVYFPHDQHPQPVLVLVAWVATTLAVLLLALRRRGQETVGG